MAFDGQFRDCRVALKLVLPYNNYLIVGEKLKGLETMKLKSIENRWNVSIFSPMNLHIETLIKEFLYFLDKNLPNNNNLKKNIMVFV